jgi:hypothetical protein
MGLLQSAALVNKSRAMPAYIKRASITMLVLLILVAAAIIPWSQRRIAREEPLQRIGPLAATVVLTGLPGKTNR